MEIEVDPIKFVKDASRKLDKGEKVRLSTMGRKVLQQSEREYQIHSELHNPIIKERKRLETDDRPFPPTLWQKIM